MLFQKMYLVYRKLLSDIPLKELFDKKGNKLNIDFITLISSLPLEICFDKNGSKIKKKNQILMMKIYSKISIIGLSIINNF